MNTSITQIMSEEEEQIFQCSLLKLLEKKIGVYTGRESSSVTVETAQELLNGALFTVLLGAGDKSQLLEADLYPLVKKGTAIVEEKRKNAYQIWLGIAARMPKLSNVFLRIR